MDPSDALVVVGVTGGIGSGKSALCEALRASGETVIDCDKVWHLLMEPGSDAFEQLKAAFGVGIINAATGKVDRGALGAIVFKDASAVNKLNGIAWPAIAGQLRQLLRSLRTRAVREGKRRLVFVEAAVLVAAGWDRAEPALFDEVWAVWAPVELRVRRLARGRGMSAEEARRRIAAQPPLPDVLSRCQVALSNFGSVEALARAGVELAADRAARGRAALWPAAAVGPWLRVVGVPPPRETLDASLRAGAGAGAAAGGSPRSALPSPAGSAAVSPGGAGSAAGSAAAEDGVDVASARAKSAAEAVLLVDGSNADCGSVRRSEMRRGRLWHRATYVFVRRATAATTAGPVGAGPVGRAGTEDRFLVHRRTAWKDYCPGFMDTNSGGVVGADEGGRESEAAARELAEEVGLGPGAGRPGVAPRVLFFKRMESERARVWAAVAEFDAGQAEVAEEAQDKAALPAPPAGMSPEQRAVSWGALAGPTLRLQASEVAAAFWLTAAEVEEAAADPADEWTPDGLRCMWSYLRRRDGASDSDEEAAAPAGQRGAGAAPEASTVGSDEADVERRRTLGWVCVGAMLGIVASRVSW
ncbi:hypothetical protein FNF31_04829 [Cafeteria roenbergensis]|uniref:Nudix hydrolase domain-containing protein n=1 Tax=Cafeteria roenbergensis TaxID=33653 RepID=A0A5A8D232_CAFRO|nr:hypothetical protein FNF31_04829 [Cafeteria roenbergensis]